MEELRQAGDDIDAAKETNRIRLAAGDLNGVGGAVQFDVNLEELKNEVSRQEMVRRISEVDT